VGSPSPTLHTLRAHQQHRAPGLPQLRIMGRRRGRLKRSLPAAGRPGISLGRGKNRNSCQVRGSFLKWIFGGSSGGPRGDRPGPVRPGPLSGAGRRSDSVDRARIGPAEGPLTPPRVRLGDPDRSVPRWRGESSALSWGTAPICDQFPTRAPAPGRPFRAPGSMNATELD